MKSLGFAGVLAVGISALLVAGSGCGGSGVGGGGGPQLTGNAAVRAVALSSYQSAGLVSYLLQALANTAPTPSPIRFLIRAKKGAAAATRQAGYFNQSYIDVLDLYVGQIQLSGTTLTQPYTWGLSGQSAGSVVMFARTGLSYPEPVYITVDTTAGNIPCTGKMQVTYTDGAGACTVTGSLINTHTGALTAFNLTLDDSLNIAGSITIRESNATVSLSVRGTLPADLLCNVSVSPGGISGTGTINPFTSNFSMNLTTPAGAATAEIDQLGHLALNYADGRNETVVNQAGAALTAGPGVTGSLPVYQTPLLVSASYHATSMSPRSPFLVGNANANGQFLVTSLSSGSLEYSASSVGSPTSLPGGFRPTWLTNSGLITGYNGAYLPSVTSAPQVLQAPGYLPLLDQVFVSDAGVFLSVSGFDNNAPGPGNLLAWTSPTSPPQVVQVPSGSTIVRVEAMAPGGAFVGSFNDFTVPLYWSSYTATPMPLRLPDIHTPNCSSMFIADGGRIAANAGAPVYWASPTEQATALFGFDGSASGLSVSG
ncbi:MAG TPA: hypothetical protein VKT78_06375, partial [Fimbriimonadaceae bacterium]|nr:hypothetical protein [Fimbriimonadaceae bacterium]